MPQKLYFQLFTQIINTPLWLQSDFQTVRGNELVRSDPAQYNLNSKNGNFDTSSYSKRIALLR